MAILAFKDTRVICQGITGKAGSFYAKSCADYGTRMVGGVTPGKGGAKVENLPVFDTVEEAVLKTGANATMIYVPAPCAPDAIREAAAAGIPLIVCITEGIPPLDVVRLLPDVRRAGARLVGPNGPGIITPGQCKMGIMPGYIHKPGPVGVVSRSGTLTYEAVFQLSGLGLGQSTCIGIGADPIVGTSFVEIL
ncbi:MAG: succinate--CoA ligase subunit alpha, partial [Planctomycetota bacterium]